jgi:sec-independent protein translocase protein TatC
VDRMEAPLIEHLGELRRRIFVSLAFLGVAFAGTFNFSENIFELLLFPLKTELRIIAAKPFIQLIAKKAVSLVFFSPAEGFWMHLKLSLIAALILSLPVTFFQFWRFISPGLNEKEKRYVIPFVVTATLLFLLGGAFCFLIILPFALTFLLGYKVEHMIPMLSVGSYMDFCSKFILAFGIIFELPLVIIFLVRFGIVTPRTLAKQRRYAVFVAFIAGAVLTPTPDVFNQTLMALPIIILYEIGILLSRTLQRRRNERLPENS